MTATPPIPSAAFDRSRANGKEMVDPVYVEVAVRVIGELTMFPGRLALGVRFSRGLLSPGGRGAGPGFMNWLLEYMLL